MGHSLVRASVPRRRRTLAGHRYENAIAAHFQRFHRTFKVRPGAHPPRAIIRDMVTYRRIVASDATAIARIHATSWRSAYRGILPDKYLSDNIDADRLAHWRRRLSAPTERDVGVLALREGAPVGFGFAVRDDDERWGSMLDNLHVLPEHKGHGLGRSLMRELVAQLAEAGAAAGLFLWVYEANEDACRFYERLGAGRLHAEVVDTAGGGRARALVYGWPSMEAVKRALAPRVAP